MTSSHNHYERRAGRHTHDDDDIRFSREQHKYRSERHFRGGEEGLGDDRSGRYQRRHDSRSSRSPRRSRYFDADAAFKREATRNNARFRSPHSNDRRRRSPIPRGTSVSDGRQTSTARKQGSLPSQHEMFAKSSDEPPEKPKEKPNWGNSGLLAAASNSVTQADGSTITLKYHEPPEARKPSPRDVWKMYVFKDSDIVDTIDLSLKTCWLFGRDMAVVDVVAEHPSISKQHAVIQFRYREKTNEYGEKLGKVKPYLLDLESANGTILNEDRILDSRYLELRNKDLIKFGNSSREYVVMLAPKDGK